MRTATAMQPTLDAAQAWMEVETRAIQLTPILRGRFWCASVDVYGERHYRSRAIRSISATARTSIGAVEMLVAKLEAIEIEMAA